MAKDDSKDFICRVRFLNNTVFGTWNFPVKGGSKMILDFGFFKKV